MYGSSMTTVPQEGLSIAPQNQQRPHQPEDSTDRSTVTMAVNTTAPSQSGQFEDADVAPTRSTLPPQNTPLAWLAAAAQAEVKTNTTIQPPVPPPSRIQRRISNNTSDATKALLAMASAASASSPALKKSGNPKKKKTFVVRLEEIKLYKERHGNLASKGATEPWEVNLMAWLSDCRKQHEEGGFSSEKAQALANVGCEGFASDDEASEKEEMETQREEAELRARQERLMMLRKQHQHLTPELVKPEVHSHPALKALMMRRQEEEARLMRMRMMAASSAAASAAARRADPDGATPTDADAYPGESPLTRKVLSTKGAAGVYPNLPVSGMAAADRQQPTLEEMYAREQFTREHLAREALAREALLQEQRFATAMAARRMSLGSMGYPPLPQMPQSRAGMLQHPPSPGVMQHPQPGRVMSLLQPLESVPPRADPALLASLGGGYNDPRVNALLLMQHQQQQRRASALQASDVMFRRPSDASSVAMERRPSDLSATAALQRVSPRTHLDHIVHPTPQQQQKPVVKPTEKPVHARARKTWDERMKEMWTFFLEHGHTQVQTRGDHKELGRWLSSVRCRMRDGQLPQQHVKEFLAMERWTLDDEDKKEVPRRNLGLAPQSVPGKVAVESFPVTPLTQPKVKDVSGGSSSQISPKNGKTKRALPKSWNQSFLELQDFKARFGHVDVKMIVNSPFGLLGKWLASQRSRHKLGQLPMDKVQRLRDLGCAGFGDGARISDQYRSQYRQDEEEAEFDAAIRRLKASNGVEGAAPVDEAPMDSPPCSPATREKRVRHSYEKRVEHIKEFKEKHGHVKIRLGSADKHEELLARWLASARSRYRGGQFKEERAAELRALGCDGFEPLALTNATSSTNMDVDSAGTSTKKRDMPARTATPSPTPSLEREEGAEPPSKRQRASSKRQSFDDMLAELVAYQYVFGKGCSVPKPDGEAGKLGRWLAFQRRQFIAGKLSGDRIEKLKTVGRKEFTESALIVRTAERAAMTTDQ